jgi:MFS superfamily sulfate permease-like transporter
MDEDHQGLRESDPAEYTRLYTGLAIQCSFLCAILNLAMGIFRVGFITQFLSRAVISGFISGAAVIIIFTQLQHVLGIRIPTANKIHLLIENLIKNIDGFTWQAFLLATLSIAFLVVAKEMATNEKIRSKFSYIKWLRASSPIIVSAVGIILVWALDLGKCRGPDAGKSPQIGPLRVVDCIPSGFPDITIGQWTPIENKLWTSVISMVIVGFVQSISLCKRLGYRRGYEVDPSQELLALGMANLIGGIFQSYPTSGAIGQTAVNDEIGTCFPVFRAFCLLLLLLLWGCYAWGIYTCRPTTASSTREKKRTIPINATMLTLLCFNILVGAETGMASVVTGLVVMLVLLVLTPVFNFMPLAAIVIAFVLSMIVRS